MEWNECACQLCGGKASFKELDTPRQRKYSCPICNEYLMTFQLNDYPNLKQEVLEYKSEIAKCLQKISETCRECVEIVFQEGSVKKKNQISLQALIDKACSMRKHG